MQGWKLRGTKAIGSCLGCSVKSAGGPARVGSRPQRRAPEVAVGATLSKGLFLEGSQGRLMARFGLSLSSATPRRQASVSEVCPAREQSPAKWRVDLPPAFQNLPAAGARMGDFVEARALAENGAKAAFRLLDLVPGRR